MLFVISFIIIITAIVIMSCVKVFNTISRYKVAIDFWCNIYIKDNMLYAAFNTGTSNLFNAWDTPNPEDVAKTYMFILREINDYLNKVIASR